MSEYTTVQTEITDADMLRLALQDIGLPFEEATLEACGDRNRLSLVGYLGDIRPQKVQFAIRRRHLGHLSNDIGWAWNESEGRYSAYVSEYDRGLSNVQNTVDQVTQRTACHQVLKTVNEYGMLVESETVTPGWKRRRSTSPPMTIRCKPTIPRPVFNWRAGNEHPTDSRPRPCR